MNILKKLVKDQKGINTIEIVVIVAIAIGIALIFKDQLTEFVNNIMDAIFKVDDVTG